MNGIDEEYESIQKAKAGDSAALEYLVDQYAPLIRSVSSRFFSYQNSADTEKDRFQAGVIGLIAAIQKYDLARRVPLHCYALPWITGEIRRCAACETDRLGSYDAMLRMRKAQIRLTKQLQREPCIREIAMSAGISAEQIVVLLNLSFTSASEEEIDVYERIPYPRDEEETYELHDAINSLDDEAKAVLIMRYYRDLTQAQTAEAIGKSQAQVSRIEQRAIDALRQALC